MTNPYLIKPSFFYEGLEVEVISPFIVYNKAFKVIGTIGDEGGVGETWILRSIDNENTIKVSKTSRKLFKTISKNPLDSEAYKNWWKNLVVLAPRNAFPAGPFSPGLAPVSVPNAKPKLVAVQVSEYAPMLSSNPTWAAWYAEVHDKPIVRLLHDVPGKKVKFKLLSGELWSNGAEWEEQGVLESLGNGPGEACVVKNFNDIAIDWHSSLEEFSYILNTFATPVVVKPLKPTKIAFNPPPIDIEISFPEDYVSTKKKKIMPVDLNDDQISKIPGHLLINGMRVIENGKDIGHEERWVVERHPYSRATVLKLESAYRPVKERRKLEATCQEVFVFRTKENPMFRATSEWLNWKKANSIS